MRFGDVSVKAQNDREKDYLTGLKGKGACEASNHVQSEELNIEAFYKLSTFS